MYESSVQHFGNFLFIKCAIEINLDWIGLDIQTHIAIESVFNAHVNAISVYHKFAFKICLEIFIYIFTLKLL